MELPVERTMPGTEGVREGATCGVGGAIPGSGGAARQLGNEFKTNGNKLPRRTKRLLKLIANRTFQRGNTTAGEERQIK